MAAWSKVGTLNGPTFNVASYGAVGNGSTDDTTAINAALQAAYSAGGGQVVFTPGKTYKITNTLWVKTNTTVVAYGATIKLVSASAIYMVNGYDSGQTMSGYTTGWSNLTFLGGTYDAQGQLAATDVCYNIMTFSNSRGVTIRDATFRNVPAYHAVDLNCVDGATVDNCRFEGFKDNTSGGTRGFSEAVQLDQGSDGNSPCKNITVSNCYMGPAIDGSGLLSFGKLTGTHTDTAGVYYTNIKVLGNTVVNSKDHAIQPCSWRDSVVANNVIINSGGDAIRVFTVTLGNSLQRLSISGNVITDHKGRGIYVAGSSAGVLSSVTVTGNTINNTVASSSPGLELYYLQNSTVSGNTVGSSLSHAAQMSFCTDVTVVGNTFMNAIFSGLQTTGCTRCTISSNHFYNLGNRGIWLTASTTRCSVINNHIIGAGRTTTNTYGSIEISNSGCTDNVIMGNRVQKFGDGGNEAKTPIVLGSGTWTSTGNSCVFNSFEGWGVGTTVATNFTLNSGTIDRAITSLAEGNNATA